MASPAKRNTKTRSLFASQPGERAQPVPFVPGPNSDLPKFIAEHSTPYNSQTDKYNLPAFDLDCQIDNAAEPKDLFDLHFYKGKKHWTAIREHIRHYLPSKYYPKGTGLVLDCFSGSGMTGVAAMMEGRPCVLIDASPAAGFISHCYTQRVAVLAGRLVKGQAAACAPKSCNCCCTASRASPGVTGTAPETGAFFAGLRFRVRPQCAP